MSGRAYGVAGNGGTELDEIFDDPRFAAAHWGVLVRSLDSGETIFSRDSEKLLVPASNAKVVTAATALSVLGPGYRFTTTVSASGERSNGTLNGSIVVTGTGDPTVSSRFQDDSRDVFRQWADSLRMRGITRVVGGVIAVDSAFRSPPIGAGWMWDDLPYGSSAEYGALQFNEGVIHLDVFPSSSTLDPAIAVLDPPTQYVRIINDTRTMPPGSVTALRVDRDDASSSVFLQGEVSGDDDGFGRDVAVRNQGLYFATVLRETLREEGIAVEGPPARHTELGLLSPSIAQAFPLFTQASPPLSEILPGMLKPSQNQIAETLLIAAGREERAEGTAEAGMMVVDSLLTAWGMGDMPYRLADGSGLSRYDLLSPAMLVRILEIMDSSPLRDLWLESLPVGGVDGTLASRMKAAPLYGNVRAKTGTMTGIWALSGYLTTTRGERVVFSMIVNDATTPTSAAVEVAERALTWIAER